MYKNILLASCSLLTSMMRPPAGSLCCRPSRLRAPSAPGFMSSPVVREVEAILQAKTAPLGYALIEADLENRIAALIRRVNASDLKLNILVTHGVSIYAEILGAAEEAEADLVVVGSHRPAMKDYLLGTNAARVVRHARCSVLVARD